MKRLLIVEFTKMHGAGNDFIVIDNRFFRFTADELAELALTYCQRRFGIGADGLLALEESEHADVDFRMRYRNADGSLGTMCGNGARCLALFAWSSGVAPRVMQFDTDGGRHRAEVSADRGMVRLWLPPPYPPLSAEVQTMALEGRGSVDLLQIWTGTEHVVSFVDDVSAMDVDGVGRAVRHATAYSPSGTNVNFAQVLEAGKAAVIKARTYEKGVEAETPACGTGAVAIAVAAVASGRVPSGLVEVRMPGGELTVGFETTAGEIARLYLEGPAQTVFRGTFELR